MLANCGLPEVEVLAGSAGGGEIALTLLRCVGWLSREDLPLRSGHAGPGLPTPGAQMAGTWLFDYSIIPHTSGWQSVFEEAYNFNAPLRATSTGLHVGELLAESSFIQSSTRYFVISAIKQSEDGHGWVVRGYNIGNQPVEVVLTPRKRFTQVFRTDLAEQESQPLLTGPDGSVAFVAGKHQIVTLKFS